jgi:hypothetical protein
MNGYGKLRQMNGYGKLRRMNSYGKLRRMTGRNPAIVVFCLYLAAAFVTIGQLIQHARTRYRWQPRMRST